MDRRLIGPGVLYPTPWRLAERHGGCRVVVCAEGHEAFSVANDALGELIVDLVNQAGVQLGAKEQRLELGVHLVAPLATDAVLAGSFALTCRRPGEAGSGPSGPSNAAPGSGG